MTEPTYSFQLTEDEMDTLLMGLRYCELNHFSTVKKKTKKNDSVLRKDFTAGFKNLLNTIYSQIHQTSLFLR